MKYKVVRTGYEFSYWSSVMDKWLGHTGISLFESNSYVMLRFDAGYTYVFPRITLERVD